MDAGKDLLEIGRPCPGLAAAGVVDGFPLHLFYQSGQRDGDVSKHKEREGKDVEELFPCGDLDLIPLAQDGEDPIEEQAQVEAGHSGPARKLPDTERISLTI